MRKVPRTVGRSEMGIRMNHSKIVKKIIILFNCAAVFFMAYVMTASAGYTVLLGDDFTHGVRVGAFHVPFFQYVAASFRYMREIYLDWQGTYFAMFLQAFLSPVNNFGMAQLKAVMMLNALLFFLSLFCMYWAASGFIFHGKKELHIRLTFFTVILFAVLDADVFTEIFFWYSGAVAYSIPYSFLFLAVTCFLLENYTCYTTRAKNTLTAFAAVFAFLASGGSLAVSGTGCYAILLMTIGFYLVSRKISVRNMIVTVAGIVGALINVAGPGNFSRHSYNSASWLLVQSVKWTVKTVWREIGRLTEETMFGVMLIIMILAGIYLSKKIRPVLWAYGIVSVLALAVGYVTAFPVAFGYGGSEFPNRCYFILDVALILSLLNFAVFAGCCLDRWADMRDNKSACGVLAVVVFASFLFAPEQISDSSLMAVAGSMHNGTYRDYYEACTELYGYLESCPEDDVALDVPEYIEDFECFYLDEDADGWVNVGVAQFYHKNSVRKNGE